MKNKVFKTTMAFCLVLLFMSAMLQAQNNPFVTKWKTDNPSSDLSVGQSSNTQIHFPGIGSNYTLIWEEVGNPSHADTITNITTALSSPLLIEFGSPGEYLVKVLPTGFQAIRFGNHGDFYPFLGDIYKILEVQQWGDIAWTSMHQAFYSCNNITLTASDVPDLSSVTDMSMMFWKNKALTGNPSLNNWDVSNVTNMQYMFYTCTAFNQDLNNWDVGNVTNMGFMFYGCTVFNQDLNNWDVSNVTNMENMFINCSNFNGELNSWDVSNVTNMENMFSNCTNFNQDLSNWNLGSVTNTSYMFIGCSAFNQDLPNWDVSKAINMNGMFSGCNSFNGDLSNWNIGNADMGHMFYGCTVFNQDLSNWDVSNVTNMGTMFLYCSNFNGNISGWDVGSVTNMSGMFQACRAFNQDLSNWDVSNVEDMNGMFSGCNFFNGDLSNWNVSKVSYMQNMFHECTAFNQDLSNWNVSSVENMAYMFIGATSFNQDLSNWDFSSVVTMNRMLLGCTAFNQDLGSWNLPNYPITMDLMLNQCGMSCTNYSNTLIGWANNPNTPDNVVFGAASLEYNTAGKIARDILTTTKQWIINNDDIYDPDCGDIAVTGVTLSPDAVDMKEGDTIQLIATVIPDNATNQDVIWSSDNTGVATVDASGLVTAIQAGTAIVTVTTQDGGYTATCTVNVKSDAVEELNAADLMHIYPNPIKEVVHIDIEHPNFEIEFYNLQGQLVWQVQNKKSISMENFPSGVYILKLIIEKGVYSSKIVKE